MIEPRSGCLIEVNPRIEELTGYSREQLLNMTLPLLHSEAEGTETMELLQRTLEHGRAATDHLAFQKRTGERIPIDLSCNLVEYQGGEVILGMVRDTTERKEVEERLQETSRLVSVGELAAGVAHEINNPLTVVIGYSELLMDKGLPEPIQSRVQRVFSEAQRAAKIVQNLLSFARRREPEKRYMDVTAILERALELKAYEFKVSNINVTSEWQPDLPRTMVDQHQLMQVILNLLTNAEQAMIDAKGGGELLIRTTRRGDKIMMSVADDGPGILPEYVHKIFDPFFTTKGVGKGTGLGLSICYGIVHQHGGEIWADSTPGKGTAFHIELPILGPTGETEEKDLVPRHRSASGQQILVVDDEPNIRQLVTEALSLEHYIVDQAEDGEEAWSKLQQRPRDCIIMDLKMPGMSGQRLYELIVGFDRELAKKVIFTTGDTVSADTHAFIAATGNPFLSKPFTMGELRTKEPLNNSAQAWMGRVVPFFGDVQASL